MTLKLQKKEFKAESKRLLDLMINSIYTNKEIFLRELLSNANDAIDKLHFKSLTDTKIESDYSINIELDKENRIIKIIDSGIGMTKEELENNLGTIAKSGSLDFKEKNEKDNKIIGQFGVGFYSAFMVAENVKVLSRAYGSGNAYIWESAGVDGYTINEAKRDNIGTTITLKIKKDDENNNYSEFLEEYNIKMLVKKYSDYLSYPIKMQCEHTRKKEGAKPEDKDAYETYKTLDTLNSITPIWNKNKNDLTDEEINDFYRDKFKDFVSPAKVIFYKTEGTVTLSSILFVPGATPFNYYTKEFKKDLQLYSKGVLIMENCNELLPDYFNFIKGMVDSQDISLNISREMLQQSRQLSLISKSLEKKVNSELSTWLKKDRPAYEKFFNNFGVSLKYGIYSSYGANKEKLKDLILFKSSFENKYVTLQEYVSRMKQNQNDIYYACGESCEKINNMPQMEFVKYKGFEVLYFTNDIDEFAIRMMQDYDNKKFKNIASQDLNYGDSDADEKNEDETLYSNTLNAMKEALKNKVIDVKISNRLKNSAVCLSTTGDISLEMEKVLNAMPNSNKVTSQKILEINKEHKIFKKLCDLEKNDKETLKKYANLLYTQAALMEGIAPENPAEFCIELSNIMANS